MAQLVEQRIRNAWVAGSSPAIGSLSTGVRIQWFWLLFFSQKDGSADLAQLVEHWLPKPRVAGSSPVIRSPKSPKKGVEIEKLTRKWKKSHKNLQGSKKVRTFAPAIKEITPTVCSWDIWKDGWVAETSSLLNCRTGSRTGGSNPPPSAPRGFLCEST